MKVGGKVTVIRSDYGKEFLRKKTKIKEAYADARRTAQGTMDLMCPVDTGALKRSSKATMKPGGVGFTVRSFGDERTGKAYAKYVDEGHHVARKDGGFTFVPAVPYFSQAVQDARMTLGLALATIGVTVKR